MSPQIATTLDVQCCIVGGGPAGVMAGLLLARAGIEVAVLEKHGDFLRDFRGDTVHPSTLQAIADLGLLDAFLFISKDERQKLLMFHNLPKLFVLHLRSPLLLNLLDKLFWHGWRVLVFF